jgi:hypothetical protein
MMSRFLIYKKEEQIGNQVAHEKTGEVEERLETHLCSASMTTLTPRSAATVQICTRSLYRSFKSWISDSVIVPVGIEECRIDKSDEKGVPGKGTGGSSGGRVFVRYVERLIKG